MSHRLGNRVAFVSGAAQGMGRSHVVRLAQEGADIIAVDLESPDAGGSFAQTIELVRATGRRILARQADVRDEARLADIAQEAYGLLGRIDIVVANAGVFPPPQALMDLPSAAWSAAIDVNLTGTWNTVRATTPLVRAGKRGGAMIITSSPYGLKGCAGAAHYSASKHAVVGLMKSLALELGPEWIRVNSIHPTTVDTHMLRSVMPASTSTEQLAEALKGFNVLPVPWIDPVDVSNAIVFLASDEARFITGTALPIDAGSLLK